MKIMFVCTANVCRSIIAQKLLEKEKGNLDIEVFSCGINAEGYSPEPIAIEIMKKYGIDISKYKSINIKDSDIESMDLILCASRDNKRDVIAKYPEIVSKVGVLKEYTSKDSSSLELTDAFGGDEEDYNKCIQEINKHVKILIKTLKEKEENIR